MQANHFGLICVMGTVFTKIKTFFATLDHWEGNESTKFSARGSNVKEDSSQMEEQPNDNDKDFVSSSNVPSPDKREVNKAREKLSQLEEKICRQKMMIDEHQVKILLLEQLIKRQCLILKENDDNFTYEQLAKSSATDSLTLRDRIENLLSSMVQEREENEENPLMKIKRDFESQRLQLQEHDECIKKHEESFEDQMARIETMREILDDNANHESCGNGVKIILDDHEKRLTALEERMAIYEKQVEKRLAEQHQLLVFTWVGLITTFVLCFAIVCSCCWFR